MPTGHIPAAVCVNCQAPLCLFLMSYRVFGAATLSVMRHEGPFNLAATL